MSRSIPLRVRAILMLWAALVLFGLQLDHRNYLGTSTPYLSQLNAWWIQFMTPKHS
jgi:hypothetical protein